MTDVGPSLSPSLTPLDSFFSSLRGPNKCANPWNLDCFSLKKTRGYQGYKRRNIGRCGFFLVPIYSTSINHHVRREHTVSFQHPKVDLFSLPLWPSRIKLNKDLPLYSFLWFFCIPTTRVQNMKSNTLGRLLLYCCFLFLPKAACVGKPGPRDGRIGNSRTCRRWEQ